VASVTVHPLSDETQGVRLPVSKPPLLMISVALTVTVASGIDVTIVAAAKTDLNFM
jgi:hypothetical protein